MRDIEFSISLINRSQKKIRNSSRLITHDSQLQIFFTMQLKYQSPTKSLQRSKN